MLTVNTGGTEPSDHSDRPVGKVAAGLLRAFGAAERQCVCLFVTRQHRVL